VEGAHQPMKDQDYEQQHERPWPEVRSQARWGSSVWVLWWTSPGKVTHLTAAKRNCVI
jgi:hypothetical protein